LKAQIQAPRPPPAAMAGRIGVPPPPPAVCASLSVHELIIDLN
jgi:hypothetical protein